MSSTFRLLEILKKVKNPGNFATGGYAADLHPVLTIKGTPEIVIYPPITQEKAKTIIEKCSQAPFGRGERTIVDTSVRRTWQLDPSQFSIHNRAYGRKWETTLAALVDEVSADLGCAASQDVSCELYKLLLYEPGGFFKVR